MLMFNSNDIYSEVTTSDFQRLAFLRWGSNPWFFLMTGAYYSCCFSTNPPINVIPYYQVWAEVGVWTAKFPQGGGDLSLSKEHANVAFHVCWLITKPKLITVRPRCFQFPSHMQTLFLHGHPCIIAVYLIFILFSTG